MNALSLSSNKVLIYSSVKKELHMLEILLKYFDLVGQHPTP